MTDLPKEMLNPRKLRQVSCEAWYCINRTGIEVFVRDDDADSVNSLRLTRSQLERALEIIRRNHD